MISFSLFLAPKESEDRMRREVIIVIAGLGFIAFAYKGARNVPSRLGTILELSGPFLSQIDDKCILKRNLGWLN